MKLVERAAVVIFAIATGAVVLGFAAVILGMLWSSARFFWTS